MSNRWSRQRAVEGADACPGAIASDRAHASLVPIASLLLLALVLRVVFVLRLPALPLYWDEVHYQSFASQYASAWRELWEPGGGALAQFRSTFEGSLQKGEAYSAFVGLVYALVGIQPRSVFVVQAVFDAVSCLFVYGIARRLGGGTIGIVALALAAVYQPFIFSVARLQTETMCTFVLLGGVSAYLTSARREALAMLGAGLLIALAMLMRPALQFLFPTMIVMIPFARWGQPRARQLRVMGAFAVGFFLLIGPRLLLTQAITGHPLWSGTTDPSRNAYAGIVFENAGWRTDHLAFALPPQGELLAVLQERGASEPSDQDFRCAVVRQWVRHPVQSLEVTLHKIHQVWLHPYNDSRRAFGLSLAALRRWHQLMLVLAAIGVSLALRNWRIGVPLAVTTLYVWATYLAVQIEVRYVVIALPLMLCFAAVALAGLATGLTRAWRRRDWRVAALVAAVLGMGILLRFATIPRALMWFDGATPEVAHAGRTVAMLLLFGLCSTTVFELLLATVPRARAALASGVAAAIAAALLVGGQPLAGSWRGWSAPLASGREAVRQAITAPANLLPPASAELRMDLTAWPGAGDLVVLVNGVETARFADGPKRDDAVPPEDFYDAIFDGQGRAQQPWHAWYAVPLDPANIVPGARLSIELRVDSDAPRKAAVRVFGDYPVEGSRVYDGPSPMSPEHNGDTSVYRYLGEGDFRMRRQTGVAGSSHPSFGKDGSASGIDLSTDPGRQYGRYRIFLLLAYPNGELAIL